MGANKFFTPFILGPTVQITAFTLTSLSTVVVATRFYCRIWVVGKLKAYDFLIAAAVLCTWGLCIINHYQVYYGTGTGEWPANLPPPTKDFIEEVSLKSAQLWYAYQIVYLLDPALIKLSILVFYLSIATSRTFRILVHITIGVVATISVVQIFINAFECPEHPSLALSPNIFLNRKQWHCFNLQKLYFSQAGINVLSDLWILILPLPVLIKLRMPTLKRISLLVVFSVGMLVPIAAAFRLWALYLWATSAFDLQRYYGGYLLFWDQVEMNTAIICASAPSLQPLFRLIFGKLSWFQRTPQNPYYFYGEGRSTMTQHTIGRRGSRNPDLEVALETPTSTYHAQKRSATSAEEADNQLVVVREVDEEEEIRNRVRAFVARPVSSYSHPPKSPEKPRDMFASG